jgi:hypothetical protein
MKHCAGPFYPTRTPRDVSWARIQATTAIWSLLLHVMKVVTCVNGCPLDAAVLASQKVPLRTEFVVPEEAVTCDHPVRKVVFVSL